MTTSRHGTSAPLLLAAVLVLVSCASPTDRSSAPAAPDAQRVAPAPAQTRVIDAVFDDGRRTLDVETLVAMAPLAPGESTKVVLVGVDAHSSHHVVALRDAEPLHRHDEHDLLAILLRGHGRMWVEGEERVIGPDSVTFVPRGTVHSLRNDADDPIVGYVVFWPPFDGTDRVLVETGDAAHREGGTR